MLEYIFVKYFCNVVPASGHEVRMVVIVMLMMIKRCWSEFAEGGPGLGLHTASASGWSGGSSSPNYTPLELYPAPTYNHTYAHNLRH